ncbi:MAG: GFA family protein [Rhodospirillales bacterium]|jgi:hypothetical protein|nr:GFA family protein [Rhodospirillales bacterium]MDP6774850.1 GFA family protein [Rhodospirillales bacterium]
MNTGQESVATGGCLCGAVRYEVRGEVRPVINCHCGQCRRFGGHFGAYTHVDDDQFTLADERGLKWYQSSREALRGFCAECGSSLFWNAPERSGISIAAGSLDQPSGLDTAEHIFVADKADYYAITDGLPQSPGWMKHD